jgi:membrane protein
VQSRLERLGHFVDSVFRRFFEDGGFTLAGSLTYTALLALVPLITVALTLVTAFPVFDEFIQGVDVFLARHMLPPAVAKTVIGAVEEFTQNAAGLTAVGLVVLGVTAILLMLSIERAFDRIWRVSRPRPLGLRLLTYGAVITLGPLLIGVSLTITSYVVTASLGMARHVPGAGTALLAAVPFLLSTTAFTLLYLIVPNRRVRVLHAMVGGVVAAVLFEATKRGFAVYVANFPNYRLIYGAFAAVPIFLVWVYLSWVVTLLGAIVVALLPDYRLARAWAQEGHAAVFRAALAILRVLLQTPSGTRAPDTRRLLAQARVPGELGERVVQRLAAAGWLRQGAGRRWSLACDPERVRLADVYRVLVFDAGRDRADGTDPAIEAILARAASGAAAMLDAPLRTLADATVVSSPR